MTQYDEPREMTAGGACMVGLLVCLFGCMLVWLGRLRKRGRPVKAGLVADGHHSSGVQKVPPQYRCNVGGRLCAEVGWVVSGEEGSDMQGDAGKSRVEPELSEGGQNAASVGQADTKADRLFRPNPSGLDESPHGMMVLVIVGMIVGLLSGMFGIGGGTVIVPALVWLGLSQRHAATSMLAIVPTSISGVISMRTMATSTGSRGRAVRWHVRRRTVW